MARLVRIIDAVAVLRPVDDAHIMVSDATRVLAVFIIAGAAAVLHRCSYRAATALPGFAGVGSTGRFLRVGDRCGGTSADDGGRLFRSARRRALLASSSQNALAARLELASYTLAPNLSPFRSTRSRSECPSLRSSYQDASSMPWNWENGFHQTVTTRATNPGQPDPHLLPREHSSTSPRPPPPLAHRRVVALPRSFCGTRGTGSTRVSPSGLSLSRCPSSTLNRQSASFSSMESSHPLNGPGLRLSHTESRVAEAQNVSLI